MWMTVSREVIDARWGAVADDDLPESYREVIVAARPNGALIGRRRQLKSIADELSRYGNALLSDDQSKNHREGRMMVRAAETIYRGLSVT
jgi:hypothetical protein